MSALFLKKQGFEVVGLTLKIWHLHPEKQEKELAKASQLAKKLKIEHSITDISQEFKKEVVDYFCEEYLSGRTPNPCNQCNPKIKWPWLLKKANEMDCWHIATGHYVRKEQKNGLWYIKKGVDQSKDQSYFLWNLKQHILERAIFPLGELTKVEVRKMAVENGFKETAYKQESMGVCFLSGTNYRDFIRKKAERKELIISHGEIVNEAGQKLGQHPGIPFFTIGQKRGLKLEEKNYFVKHLERESNKIIVSKSATLSTKSLTLSSFYLTPSLFLNKKYAVDIRVRGIDKVPSLPGTVSLKNDKLEIDFTEEAWGITPGQSIVFYINDSVIGGGIVS